MPPPDITPPWPGGPPEKLADALWRWCEANWDQYRIGDAIRELFGEREAIAEYAKTHATVAKMLRSGE